MQQVITGIQQVGIGVKNANEAKLLYKDLFGMDVLIFEDKAEATLMTKYTNNIKHSRHAILSLNLNGGGGFEIWQFTSRNPTTIAETLQLGDLGIFGIKIKTKDVYTAHKYFAKHYNLPISTVLTSNNGKSNFWLKDNYNNHFNIVEGEDFFGNTNSICGGVMGAVIGVSSMQHAIKFYSNFLGINEIEYHITETVSDFFTASNEQTIERAVLKKSLGNYGAFSKLLGSITIELIEAKNRQPIKIFANRYWGDCGFIHLCFDVLDMDILKQQGIRNGYSFSVDSANTFAMGKSGGRFCYVEDPDGTLIELVETHKVPIFKKMGWYLNIKKGVHQKPLPNFMIKLLGLSKVK